MAPRFSSRVRTRAIGLLTGATAVAAALAVGSAGPASAATCASAGHAYLTQPGALFFSGFEGNQQNGVPTAYATQNATSFRVGGNGIAPASGISFVAVDRGTGARAPFFQNSSQRVSNQAGINCVANESGSITVTAPPGTYRILATYIAGNSRAFVIDEPVVDVVVSAPAPPPPYDPYPDPEPCYRYQLCQL
jgi:hypothetical protein